MKELNFKPLMPEQIEVRVAEAKTKGTATVLLYIDSRSAADIMDEVVGPFNWKMEYKDVAGQIYGRLSIFDEDKGEWVYREDTGEESNIAAAKGMSSDILKRCLARWGCNYLYSSPKIKLKNLPESYYMGEKLTMVFAVDKIEYEGKKISCLVIVDRWGHKVFDWSKGDTAFGRETPKDMADMYVNNPPKVVTNEDILVEFCRKKKEEGWDKADLKSFYEYWNKRLDKWTGSFQPDLLFKKHIERKVA